MSVSNHLTMFERLGYGALALALLNDLIGRNVEAAEACVLVIATLLAAALVWAAARKGQRWPMPILILIALLSLFGTVGEFWTVGPAWLQAAIKPETLATPLTKTLDVVVTAMLIAALYFYYSADDGPPS